MKRLIKYVEWRLQFVDVTKWILWRLAIGGIIAFGVILGFYIVTVVEFFW